MMMMLLKKKVKKRQETDRMEYLKDIPRKSKNYFRCENVFEKSLPKKSLKEKKGELFYSVVSKRTFH